MSQRPRPSVRAAPRARRRLVPSPEPASSTRDPVPSAGQGALLRPVRVDGGLQLAHMGATGLKPAATGSVAAPGQRGADAQPLALEPADIDCIAELAYEYAVSGAYEVARVLYAGLVALRPDDANHRLGLGLVLDRQGRPDAAEVEYRRAARLAPTNPLPRVSLAELCLARGDRRSARAWLREAHRCSASSAPPTRLGPKISAMMRIIDSSAAKGDRCGD